jgi:hypothetical protein
MPYTEVMAKWKAGKLRSGSKSGPKVKSQKQAVAIMLSEKRASKTKPEYRAPKRKNTRGILGIGAGNAIAPAGTK